MANKLTLKTLTEDITEGNKLTAILGYLITNESVNVATLNPTLLKTGFNVPMFYFNTTIKLEKKGWDIPKQKAQTAW